MLTSVLKSQRVVEVNIYIVLSFIKMRKMITETGDLRDMICSLENKYDKQFQAVLNVLQKIIKKEPPNNKSIGFICPVNKKEQWWNQVCAGAT